MRRVVFGAVVMAAVVLLAAGPASAEPVTFTLSNGSSATIVEFYASPPNVASWEEDILGDHVLSPGEGGYVTIADGREDCTYDFLAVFEDDDGNTWEVQHDAVEVCDGESYVYTD